MRSLYRLLAGALFFSVACGDNAGPDPIDAGAADSGAVEDLCNQASPCTLIPGTMQTEHIGAMGDEDYYTFDVVNAGTVLQLSVTNDADFSPIKLEVVLFDSNNQSLRNERFAGNGKQRVDIQYVAGAGRYTVKVADVGNDQFDRRNPYFIVVQLFSQTDNNEPNNTSAEATALTAGMGTSGTIGSQGDQDWFAIDIPANQLTVISMTASGGENAVRLRYQIYEPTGTTVIAEGFEPEGATTSLLENRAVGNAAGRYLVRIFDTDNDQADLMRVYVLTVSFVAEPDQNDVAAPNETRASATSIVAGQTYTGFIAAKSDFDYYAINVTGASMDTPRLLTVEANMANTGPVDLAFLVLVPAGDDLVCQNDPTCKAFRFVPDGPERPTKLATSHNVYANGRYIILVKDNQDNEWDTGTSYTIRAEVRDEPEANERYERAREGGREIVTSTAGTTLTYPWVEGYISYADDEDWFTFAFPGPMGAPPGQNGDWLVNLQVEKAGPTPVELEVFFFSSEELYGGFGEMCRMPAQGDPDPTGLACQFPDADNAIMANIGETAATIGNLGVDCLVVFRERTMAGPHFIRITDLNRDDFDLASPYRFRVTLTARCTPASVCAGQFPDVGGGDLCARP
jgi:hypothetical protein